MNKQQAMRAAANLSRVRSKVAFVLVDLRTGNHVVELGGSEDDPPYYKEGNLVVCAIAAQGQAIETGEYWNPNEVQEA